MLDIVIANTELKQQWEALHLEQKITRLMFAAGIFCFPSIGYLLYSKEHVKRKTLFINQYNSKRTLVICAKGKIRDLKVCLIIQERWVHCILLESYRISSFSRLRIYLKETVGPQVPRNKTLLKELCPASVPEFASYVSAFSSSKVNLKRNTQFYFKADYPQIVI